MTTKKWLETLPNGLKDTALAQMDKSELNKEQPKLSIAIFSFKLWRETIEGFDFWNSLYGDLEEKGL